MHRFTLPVINLVLSALVAAYPLHESQQTPAKADARGAELIEVAHFDAHRPTGVAVSRSGRVFVSFPRWADDHEWSVVEVLPDGSTKPFPDETMNSWVPGSASADASQSFVCVQSVWVDDRDMLWVLDPAAPKLEAIVPGGPKLVKIDLGSNRVADTFLFDSAIAPEGSYLNDVRIDTERNYGYITDSGLGALIAVDLKTKQARRLLADHACTKAEPDVTLTVQGVDVRTPDGETPQIHADGIALSHDGEYLYWHALTGKTLYRIATCVLRQPASEGSPFADESANGVPDMAAMAIEKVGETVVTDGMLIDKDGRVYHTALERDAIMRHVPGAGRMETVVHDPRISWPDSMAFGPNGDLYFTTSQIHFMPKFNPAGEAARTEPFRLFRVKLGE